MRFLLLLPFLLAGFATAHAQRSYLLTFTEAELIRNEHVGNEWARGVWLGEEAMERNQPVRLAAGKRYELSIAAAETNEKYNDRGDESVELTPALLARALPNGGFYLDVTVTERNGRYAGGKAVWRFYFDLR